MATEPTASSTTSSMMALRAHERGGPEQLVYEEAPRPVPGTGEILVAVRAAAITFAELTWPETWETGGVDRTPIIPSHEVAGVVAEVGPDVTDLAVGDSVFGLVPFNRDGAAAALPALTAWDALGEHAHLAAGQRLLIRGGTGGVGAFVTQLARRMGVEVTVTVTSASAEARARSLGADHVIVGAPDPDESDHRSFDAAIDAAGANVPEWMYASLRPGGRLIVLQEPPSQELADKYGVTAVFFVVRTRREKLEELAALIAAGQVEVAIAQTFPLSAGRAAYESGSLPKPGPGKTVLLVP
jgi:NADPH:quinone reductase-like Zn-dependent oxidoreductase